MKNLNQRNNESDLAYYKRLAKRADQRLVSLEKLSHEKGYENVLKYAYANAIYDIRSLSHNYDAKRFNIKLATTSQGAIDQRNLNARINAVRRFLESPTSTKSGITTSYKQRADTINDRYGTNFTWQEMQAYFERRKTELSDSAYGSKTELRAYGAIMRHNMDEIRSQIAKGESVRIADDMIVNEIAIRMITDGTI